MRKMIFTLFIIHYSLVIGGAQTWQILPNVPPAGGRWEDLWFINETTGWFVECGGQGRILKTTDGGLSFINQFQAVG
ncbi:MAG: hypothetical protein ACRDFC_09345, partial [Ignavibacteria bacterium]